MSVAAPTEGATRITILQTPPSLNRIGARGNPRQFHRRKKGWQQLLEEHLLEGAAKGALPGRMATVVVSGRLDFRVNRRRDEGNYRTLLEKAMGDALVGDPRVWPEGRWLPDDTPDRYRFERLLIASGAEQDQTTLVLRWTLPDDG